MPVPSQPAHLLPRVFAEKGTHIIIPDTKPTAGRASFTEGFPEETQKPLHSGGIAPNRTDFNGLFRMLSAFAFWQQSGGMFSYAATLNYAPPALVFHSGKLWWCVKRNGPETTDGVRTPGTNQNYWKEFLEQLAESSGARLGGGSGVPVGTVISYYGTKAPEGYFACNGASFSAKTYPQLYAVLGSANLPDMRGYFVRGYDTRNSVDPEGAGRAIGSAQTDAGRRLNGTAQGHVLGIGSNLTCTGPFYNGGSGNNIASQRNSSYPNLIIGFDSQLQWGESHTSTEFRGKNICLLYCIKHDEEQS